MYEKLQKNTAQYIVFPLVDADGDFVTGATITGEYNYWEKGVAPQSAFIALTNAEVEIGATGVYQVQLTAAETNHGYVTVLFTSGTSKPQLLEYICMTGDPLDLSVHTAADVWTAGSRALTTPADYKANVTNLDAAITTRAPANEYDTELDVVLSTRSSHNAAAIWAEAVKVITGGVLTTPNDYKANVTDMATNTNVDANETKIDTAITDIGNLNNLSSANVQTVLETNDLDHLLKVAHPSGDPIANTIIDLIMNKDAGQTYSRATDSLEIIGEGGGGATAQQVWEYASPRTLSTPADYKATGFSTHNAADIWTAGSRALSTPNDYKAVGFSTHNAAAIWSEVTKVITGGVLTTPSDYKATGFSTHAAADIWTAGSRELSTPANYKATGFSTHAAADVWSVVTRQLSGTISDFDALDTALDSAHGAGSWLTGGGGSGIVIQVIPSIPKNIDLSNTKLIRIALYVIDASDDLPTTAEITPGTITIDRSADGGTSWGNIVNAAACLEHAGCIYYDEVFDSGTGYASSDMIRITFKGQKVTISANDFEIADSTDGMVFTTRIDSGLSGGGPSAGDIADAVWNEPIADHVNALYFGGKNQKVVPSETIADYKATGFSTHGEADVWTTGSRELSTPADYKAVGFSTHAAADIWSVGTRVITGGALTTPADYKATGFSVHNAAAIWAEVSKVITGGVLTTPTDYKAVGFSVPNEYDAVITALQTDSTAIKGKTDNLPTNTQDFLEQQLGLADKNSYIDLVVTDISDRMTSCRKRIYDSKANAITHGATGLLHTFNITVTYNNGDLATYLVTMD